MTSSLPRQDIPETQKTPKWFKEHLDYAQSKLKSRKKDISKIDRLYRSYNGITDSDSVKYLVNTYGKRNRSTYIDYRISKTKLDMLHGEWLKMPLNATIKTINSEAVTAKMKRHDLINGAMNMKGEIEKLRELGVDPLEGMEIPDKNDPDVWSKISIKDKNEINMQLILKEQIAHLDIVQKIGSNFQDAEISSYACGEITVNELTGEVDYEPFDPRDAIFEEYDRDPFMEKSFLVGRREMMPIHKILTRFKLTTEQRNKLEGYRKNPDTVQGSDRFRDVDGDFCAEVLRIYWKSVTPKYTKLMPKTNAQMEYDSTEKVRRVSMGPKSYEGSEGYWEKEKQKGNVEDIVIEWEQQMYEAVRIGDDIDINLRPKPFLIKDEDTGEIDHPFVFMCFNKVDGYAVSIQEMAESFSNIFNIVMFQILKELNKAKGKVLGYDRAALPKGQKVKQVLYNALNDSFIDFDSSAGGNMAQRDLSLNQIIKEYDLGLSQSFQYLIALKQDVQNSLDRITGINQNREGQIKASSTVANAESSVEASRTITEPFFYHMTKFSERVLWKIVETTKLAWALYKPERARVLLGDEKFQFLETTTSLAFARYGVHLTDPRQETLIRQRIMQQAEAALNAKEIRLVDVMDMELSDTVAEMRSKLRKAWEELERIRQTDLQNQSAAQKEMNDAQIAANMKIAQDNREDMQTHDIDKIVKQGQVDIAVKTADAKNKAVLKEQENDHENLGTVE